MKENERSPEYIERENTLFKACLNVQFERLILEWRSQREIVGFLRGENTVRFDALIQVAQDAGIGISLQIKDRSVTGGEKPFVSEDAKKLIEHGTRETIILTTPSLEERKKLHSRQFKMRVDAGRLVITSGHGIEASFPRKDIVSLEVR
jgi:hypothetical protein